MSIPLQVLVSSGSLLPAIEEISARAGTIGGAQMLWVMPGPDEPDWSTKAVVQVRAMVGARSHEGGFAQVLLAADCAGLQLLAERLRSTDFGREPFARIGIVLAEEAEVVPLTTLGLTAIHAVPQTLAYRELDFRERERSAVNLLGLLVDMLRLPQAREGLQQWCATYAGVRVTVAQAARFQAPVVQRVLARRLAARVADRMVQTLLEGTRPATAPKVASPPDAPQHDIESALRDRASEIGERIAPRIVGEGDLPDEEQLQLRAEAAAGELPAKLEDVLKRHGSELREQALAWQTELRRWSDDNLERAGFAALPVLIDRLVRWRETSGGHPLSQGEHGPRQAMQLDPPDDGEVRGAVDALARAKAMHDDSAVLFGGWALAIAAVVGLSAYAGTAKFGDLRMLLCGAAAAVTLLGAWTIATVRQRVVDQTLARLLAAEQAARAAYRDAWSRLIARQIADIGQHLHERMVRFADEVVATELDGLQAVHDTLRDLQQQHQKPERLRVVGDGSFDSDIRLPESFYTKAESKVDPTDLFNDYDARMRSPNWRQQLEFMNSEALTLRCAGQYASFREQIPFAERSELREVALFPAQQAMEQMVDRLLELMPAELQGSERFVVLPAKLADAIPDTGVGHQRVHYGLADIYAAITRPATAGGR